MTTSARQPTIVLVGAGHAHLHIAARAQAYRDAGARLLLIDPGEFWYSGMATGLLGGEFDPDEDRIDPNALMQASGGAFIREAVTRICPDNLHAKSPVFRMPGTAIPTIQNVGTAVPGVRDAWKNILNQDPKQETKDKKETVAISKTESKASRTNFNRIARKTKRKGSCYVRIPWLPVTTKCRHSFIPRGQCTSRS